MKVRSRSRGHSALCGSRRHKLLTVAHIGGELQCTCTEHKRCSHGMGVQGTRSCDMSPSPQAVVDSPMCQWTSGSAEDKGTCRLMVAMPLPCPHLSAAQPPSLLASPPSPLPRDVHPHHGQFAAAGVRNGAEDCKEEIKCTVHKDYRRELTLNSAELWP